MARQQRSEGGQDQSLLLGRTIAGARQKAGLTQQQLCRRMGLSYSTLTKIERGVIQTPSVFTIAQIARGTGISIEELLAPVERAGIISPTGVKMVYFGVDGVLIDGLDGLWLELAATQNQSPAHVERRFWRHWPTVQHNRETASQAHLPAHGQNSWASDYAQASRPIKPLADLLVRLGQKFRVGLLTNTPRPLLQRLFATGKLPRAKYQTILSADSVGATKPAGTIYNHGQKLAGLDPDQILLVDHSPLSLARAESLGWKVHRVLTRRPNWTANRLASYLRV